KKIIIVPSCPNRCPPLQTSCLCRVCASWPCWPIRSRPISASAPASASTTPHTLRRFTPHQWFMWSCKQRSVHLRRASASVTAYHSDRQRLFQQNVRQTQVQLGQPNKFQLTARAESNSAVL